MSKIDIRTAEPGSIETIVFADTCTYDYYADQVTRHNPGGIKIKETDSDAYVAIKDQEHADNLIKAIEKAKALGWI